VAVAPSYVARRLRRSVGLPERDGLLVRGVEGDSPAARAGIQEGDLIVGAAGRDVTDADALFEALASAGDTFEVRILRGTEERTVKVGGTTAATGEA
jgi:serine protease Do